VPFLRFTRDRRGYENTYLVHTTRRRGRDHARVLYWYRSPPHIKVGRPALDEEAIRTLERSNPDVVFDWTAILQARPDAEPVAEGPPPRRRNERDGRGRIPQAPGPARSDSAVVEQVPEQIAPPAVEGSEPDEPPETKAGHLALEPSAAELALGAEGLARLRARHAEVLARIGDQIEDPVRAEELRMLAEALNPDAWVTGNEVASGLEHFEATLDRIRRELGPPRHRSRRPRHHDQPIGIAPAGTPADAGARDDAGRASGVPDEPAQE
jgi:hypothetical protein